MTVLYVDVSHHDWSRHGGQLDWARIREATSPVMVARATYGDPSGFSPETRYFGSMVKAARSAGFLTGGYHNLVRGDAASIARQVDWLRREMDATGAAWAMLDVERYDELVSRNLHPRFDDARRFVERWRAVDRRVLTVYLPRWIWDGHMGRPDLRPLRCPLVASDYGTNPDGSPASVYRARGGDTGRGWNAYGGATPTMWQYGSNIDCPGASGQTDVNAYRGTLAQLRALLTGSEEDPMALADVERELAELRADVRKILTGNLAPNPDTGKPENAVTWWLRMLANNADPTVLKAYPDWPAIPAGLAQLGAQLAVLRADVAALAGRDPVDEAQLADLLAPQLVAAVTAQLPDDLGGMTRDQVVGAVEQGVRDAFAGGLAPDAA